MKSNKVKVFEFIKEYSITQSTDEYPKLTTQYLSEKLDMQRTNLSSILNQLVKEGKITKTDVYKRQMLKGCWLEQPFLFAEKLLE